MNDLSRQTLIDLDHFPCGCLITAKDSTIVLANKYFSDKLGWSSRELTGQSANTLFSKPTQLFCESYIIPTVFSEGRCCEVQVSLLNADGAPVPKVASVRRMPNGHLTWIFLEAEQRNRLFQELDSARHALQEQREQLEHMTRTDPLTGLANRRELERAAPDMLRKAKRNGTSVSVLMLDVDHFKTLNDTYGHEVGDQALSRLADVLRFVFRDTDLVARLGGDEFACVLADTDLKDAQSLAHCIRIKLAQADHAAPRMTASIGISERRPNSHLDLQALLKQADKALYEVKRAGRNAVGAAWVSD